MYRCHDQALPSKGVGQRPKKLAKTLQSGRFHSMMTCDTEMVGLGKLHFDVLDPRAAAAAAIRVNTRLCTAALMKRLCIESISQNLRFVHVLCNVAA